MRKKNRFEDEDRTPEKKTRVEVFEFQAESTEEEKGV